MNFAKLTEIKVVANGMTDLEGMYIKEKNKAAINKSSFNHFAASIIQGFGSESGRNRCFLPGFGFDFQISLDPGPVCPERLVPDPVNIRPNPKAWFYPILER